MISDKFNQWKCAVVHLKTKRGDSFVDCAAHVFEAMDGFAFLNPGYYYPETSHLNNFHRIEAKLTEDGDRIAFDGSEYSGHIEEWTGEVPQIEVAGDSLYRYEVALDDNRVRYSAERERLLKAIKTDLDKPL